MEVFDEMWEEAKRALLDERNLAIAMVGGAITFIGGIVLAPFGLGMAAVGVGSTATLIAYFSKAFLDFAYVTKEEDALRQERGTLRGIYQKLVRLESQLTELYKRYAYRTDPHYTMEEFKVRRHQLTEVFENARAIQELLKGEEFGEVAWQTIMPEIQNLVRIAVLLYHRRLFLLGQLFGMGVGGNEELGRLQTEVARRVSELQERGLSDDLRQRRADALDAARRQLRAFEEGLGSPDLLVSHIDKVEADFDTVRLTLGEWVHRLRAQAAQVALGGPSMGEIETLRQELIQTVQSLQFTVEAQEEMGKILKEEVTAGLQRMQMTGLGERK